MVCILICVVFFYFAATFEILKGIWLQLTVSKNRTNNTIQEVIYKITLTGYGK